MQTHYVHYMNFCKCTRRYRKQLNAWTRIGVLRFECGNWNSNHKLFQRNMQGLACWQQLWNGEQHTKEAALPSQTKLTKMGSDPFSNHISIYRIVPDNRLHVTQSLLEAKAIIMEKNHSFFGDWRLQTDHFKITWPLINLISNLVRKNTLWRQNYERIWSQKVLCAWLKSSKLCNQVPSLSLSRWRTLTLLKI